jgi:hypothetical protein
MLKNEFLNRLRSLFHIDGEQLPELTAGEQLNFIRNPTRYFMICDDGQQDAIWREIEKRQKPAEFSIVDFANEPK